MTLEETLLVLAAIACPARRVGRATWRAPCPRCGASDALSVTASALGLVGVLCSRGCPRVDVLATLEESA